MQFTTMICRFLLMLAISLASFVGIAANQLEGHPSPYLALHANDPVNWRPWQDDVFIGSARDNRLVFVSIGYFSCHWCHVMQQESYQDPNIAKILNNRYISVKVDRELEPDLDQRLIEFVEKIRGSAGWPLNVFLTPDGYPVTGFTYLPPQDFANVLQQLDREWSQNHEKIAAAAQDFFQSQMQDHENQAFIAPEIPASNLIQAFVSQAMLAADELQGGFGNVSKFPNVPQMDTLLQIIERDKELDPDVAKFVNLTLREMASKNLHDHVNGGFFRYTTDPDWQTPHFEKMLYDNAQLSMLYLKAHRLWPDRGYAAVAMRTLDFIETSLKHSDGGYMSSLSAVDADNREGGSYYWSRSLLEKRLSQEQIEYLVDQLELEVGDGEFLMAPLTGPGALGDRQRNARILKILQQRDSSMPIDHKRLAAWNAMMLKALLLAAQTDPRFSDSAHELFGDMRDSFYRDGRLNRLAGNARVADAVFEDYAQVAHAFFEYGQAFDHPDSTDMARQLVESAHSLFLKNDRWQQKARSLIPLASGKWIIPDLVFYSPMTLWLQTALALPELDIVVRDKAMQMRQRATRDMLDSPYFYGSFILLRTANSDR